MDDQTFRSRLVDLMKQSRKAVRIYSTFNRGNDPAARYIELQAEKWKEVNTELLRLLSAALDHPGNKKLTLDIQAIRDRFDQEWRQAESEMNVEQARLLTAAQSGDFIRCAVLSGELVAYKAKYQAAQAAYQELSDILKKSRVAEASIELPETNMVSSVDHLESIKPTPVKPTQLAKIIPISRKFSEVG